ncbi:hypothetical protein CMI47_12290 [Candidatus Pacearchaeota archaeon]|jgi:hypothetical protein|nr:hypothetical protein [Candidatus Pacearchaeota archaeon]|tara:strand:+ start:1431 stop:2411 length:981 start_codon:yes stop_codon:yes gene_type:complete
MAEDTEEEEVVLSTDEAILDSIGEGDESTSSTEAGTTDSTEATGTTGTGKGAGSKQGVAEGTRTDQGTRPSAGPQALTDRDGNVIAEGGKERRFYETAQREKARADSLQRDLDTSKAQIEAISAAGNLGTQYSLSPEELTTGAQIVASYKTDPVATIQYLLTQAQAAGHNIDALGGSNMDASAVKQMLDTALAPLLSEHQTRADTQAADNRALEIYNEFSTQHPDAAVHEGSLARLLTQEPSLSPEAAYYKLQNYYLAKGLDWTKSLEQLQQEATARTPAPGDNTPQPPEGGVNVGNTTDTPVVADVSKSFDDIIKESMAEAGIND